MDKIKTMKTLLKKAKGMSKRKLNKFLDMEVEFELYMKIKGDEHIDKVNTIYNKRKEN